MLEELKQQGYAFQKGKIDACVFTCPISDVTVIRHVDDTGAGGPDHHLKYLHSNTSLGAHLDLKTSARIEAPGTMVRRLGRTKIRTEDEYFTIADDKHAANILRLLEPWMKGAKPSAIAGQKMPTEPGALLDAVDATRAAVYPKATGSAIYLSLDRDDIKYEVKELAKRMAGDRVREHDFANLVLLARYLLGRPTVAKVTRLNAESMGDQPMTMDTYTDSDWANCQDTRRSTDGIMVNVAGTNVITHPQTQPGLPATSSGDAETRGLGRGGRETMYVKQLAEHDFLLPVAQP